MPLVDGVTKAGSNERCASPIKRVWYTGKTIHATKASRALVTLVTGELPPIGGAVCYDPYGHDKGLGTDVTKPYTATLAQFAGIVVNIPKGTSALKGGWIDVCPKSDYIQALTKIAGAIPITEPTMVRLIPVNDKWYLGAQTESIASGVLNFYALQKFVGYTLDATDTSAGSGALVPIRLCPWFANP